MSYKALVQKIGKNVIKSTIVFPNKKSRTHRIALMSDLHWDNPKCDRKLLKEHLDYCKVNNIRIALNGDTFCLMQGAYDPRKSKSDIREEHNKVNYIDAVVNTAIDFFAPYAHLIDFIGYGNHETSIIKRLETDPLERFVGGLNAKVGTHIQTGGYGGWYLLNFNFGNSNTRRTYKIKYFHGSGGGGIVTRGEINLTRISEMVEGADMTWIGHVHESKETVRIKETISSSNNVKHKQVLSVITPPYKEEYGAGDFGWHVQRGAPPKPIGCRILELELKNIDKECNILARTIHLGR